MKRASLVRCMAIVVAAIAGGWTSNYKNEIPAFARPNVTSYGEAGSAFARLNSTSYGAAGSTFALLAPAARPLAILPSTVVRPPTEGRPAEARLASPERRRTSTVLKASLLSAIALKPFTTDGFTVTDETAVRALLERYRGAYERLDAAAASQAWPSMNRRVLAKAFADLNSLSLKFDSCQIDVADTRGVASCRGRSTYVGRRLGGRKPFTREGEWTFALSKTGDEWKIDTVQSR